MSALRSKADLLDARRQRQLLTDTVDKVSARPGWPAFAAAGLSWVVLAFLAPPGFSHRRYGTPLELELT